MLQSANVFPSEVIMKSKLFFIGRILEMMEVRRFVKNHLLSHPAANVLLSPPAVGDPG